MEFYFEYTENGKYYCASAYNLDFAKAQAALEILSEEQPKLYNNYVLDKPYDENKFKQSVEYIENCLQGVPKELYEKHKLGN